MGRLDLVTRRRVVVWRSKGYSIVQILDRLKEEDITTSAKTIYCLLHKFKTNKSVHDLPRGSRKKLTVEHYCFIDDLLAKDDEITCTQLHQQLHDKFPQVKVSLATVKRAKKDLGWVSSTPHYCQLIREKNKAKRLEWCQKCVNDDERFSDVIWTDECSVQLDPHRKIISRRKGTPKPLKPRPKHPQKIHIWGGISMKGPTPLVMFGGILNATRYAVILENGLLPFIQKYYPRGHRLQQDNDPKHRSKFIQSFFARRNVNWWKTPPESPDLNPIELVWGSLKTYLRNTHFKKEVPRNLSSLKEGISNFWKGLTPEICQAYIMHIHTVIPEVIHRGGEASGY